jgi:hypothetical protein
MEHMRAATVRGTPREEASNQFEQQVSKAEFIHVPEGLYQLPVHKVTMTLAADCFGGASSLTPRCRYSPCRLPLICFEAFIRTPIMRCICR